MARARLEGELGWNDSAFVRGIGSATTRISRLAAHTASKAAAMGAAMATVGAAAATAGFAIAAAGVALVGGASVKAAADMETLRVAFEVVLGSADAARERMEELSRFAATTPFELPEIAKASKTLQSLTDGVLATGKGLTLVGDIAAATGQPFEEMAVTVGRLYSGLMSGTAAGESVSSLQELAVMSPKVRAQLEAMQAQGLKGKAVWDVYANSVSGLTGMMDKQSRTFNGLVSSLMDGVAGYARGFGEPLMEFLKPGLQFAIDAMGEFESGAAVAGEKFVGYLKQATGLAVTMFAEPEKYVDAIGLSLQHGIAVAGNHLALMFETARDLAASVFQKGYVEALGAALLADVSLFGAEFGKAIYEITLSMSAGLEWAFQQALEFFDGGWRGVAANLQALLANAFTRSVAALKAGLLSAFEGAKWVWDKILQGISKMPGIAKATKESLAQGLGDISGAFAGGPREQESAGPFKAENYAAIRQRQADNDTGVFKQAIDSLSNTAAVKWTEAGEKFGAAAEATSNEVAGALERASGAVRDVFGAAEIGTKAAAARSAVVGAGNKVASALGAGAATAATAIATAAKDFASKVAPSTVSEDRAAANTKRFGAKNRGELRRMERKEERAAREFDRGVDARTDAERATEGMDPGQRQAFAAAQREADFNKAFHGEGPRSSLKGGKGLTEKDAWADQFKPKGNPLGEKPAPGKAPDPVAKDDAGAIIKDESIDKIVTKIGELIPK